MDLAAHAQTRNRMAFALSIAGHACALFALAALIADREIADTGPVEKDFVLPITTIAHREPAPARVLPIKPRHRSLAGVAPHADVPPKITLAKREATEPAVATASAVAARKTGRRNPVRRAPLEAAILPAPTVAVARPAPVAATAAAAPVATPDPAPDAASPVPAVAANYSGLFSQNYPPALVQPDELTAIRAELPARARVRVDVDDAGNATDVHLESIDDAALAAHVRTELLALHYVPADCNGLHCEGSLEIAGSSTQE